MSNQTSKNYYDSKAAAWEMVWELLKAHNPVFFEAGESGREAVTIEIRRLQALDKPAHETDEAPTCKQHGYVGCPLCPPEKATGCRLCAGTKEIEDSTGRSAPCPLCVPEAYQRPAEKTEPTQCIGFPGDDK